MPLLPDHEVVSALSQLPGWQRNGKALEKSWHFPDFAAAMVFVNRVAEAAEAANHHPDIFVHYNRVHLTLYSHDLHGITRRDIRLAGSINRLEMEIQASPDEKPGRD